MSADERRLLRLEINRIRMAERRAKETSEERALRLYKNRTRNKLRRATETPEQRADRNRRNMERNRIRRSRQREGRVEATDCERKPSAETPGDCENRYRPADLQKRPCPETPYVGVHDANVPRPPRYDPPQFDCDSFFFHHHHHGHPGHRG